MKKFDFSGWATRNNLKCSDGRTILKDAFKHNDGQTVPLVWNHQHNDPLNVLGHALLENRDEGVYAYCKFNDTESGQNAKLLVQHGDVSALSIYANQLQQNGGNVYHGAIREVSLVLAGANPGAFIDSVMSHSDDSESDNEAIIYTGEEIALCHSDEESDDSTEQNSVEEAADENVISHGEETSDNSEDETLGEIFGSMNEKQQTVVYAMMSQLMGMPEDNKNDENNDSEGGENTMKHNVFDQDDQQKENVISHSEMAAIIADGKRYGSLKESALAHGIEHIDYLFPDQEGGTNVTRTPIFIDRETGWVKKVMAAVHKTPFSRIKSLFADITADEARARGYMKGNLKKEEVFTLLKRTTSPTTVYKKQKLDRDDVIDVVDFDSVAWIKGEMRGKLDEELAGAFLVGDRRLPDNDDKIKEDCIRPIWTDDPKLFVINKVVEHDGTEEDRAKAFIKGAIKARKNYKGSGSPTLYTTEDMLTEMLLLTDQTGRDLYEDEAKLAKKLRVKEIVTVPVMENLTRVVGSDTRGLLGIIVNLNDYNVGADKGGAVSMFDDFDIDYNAQKYLIETRCSGALIMPFSAIVIEDVVTAG
jgi:HK97 family phage prohead protease